MALFAPVRSMQPRCAGVPHTKVLWTVSSQSFRFISSPRLPVFLNSAAVLLLLLSSIVIFILTALLDFPTVCLHPYRCLAGSAHDCFLYLTPMLSKLKYKG